jgi:phage recombination protein Bet
MQSQQTTKALTAQDTQQTAAMALYAREQIDTLKRTVAKGASDADLALFLEFCRARSLDPFTKQVHWTQQGIICGIDGFRAIADRTGAYVPGPTTYETDEKGALVAAHVTVRKHVAGQWFDICESAYLSEYQGRSPIWRDKPRVMLAKCAESRALRRAFPSQLSGMYAPEEMDRAAEPRDVTPAPVAAPAQPVSRRSGQPSAPVPVVAAPPAPAPAEVIATATVIVEQAEEHDAATGEVAQSFACRSILEATGAATSTSDLDAVARKTNAARKANELQPGEFETIKLAVQDRRAQLAGGR